MRRIINIIKSYEYLVKAFKEMQNKIENMSMEIGLLSESRSKFHQGLGGLKQ